MQPTSELVTAHDLEKPEMADREITRVVIFPNSKKISMLGTIPQTAARALVVTSRVIRLKHIYNF
jgi:hypothetical protein